MARKKKENKIITLDTETIGLDGDIKRIAIYDGKKVHYGYIFEDIEPILLDYAKDYKVHIYIHNLEFDARKMPKIFERYNVLWSQSRIINNRYVKISCKKYTLHDSFSLLPESLASLSKSFDLTHGKLDLWEEVQKEYPGKYTDVVDFLSRCHPDNPLYLKYLGYDVISLYELIEKIISLSGLSLDDFVKTMTTASLSRKIFKNGYKGKRFGDGEKSDFEILTTCKAWRSSKEINNNHSDIIVSYAEIENKIREAYFGGRTEVFIPLAERAFYYDVNSLYPFVMALLSMLSGVPVGQNFPVGYPSFYKGEFQCKLEWNTWKRKRLGLGFLKCKVYVPEQQIPPLPVKRGKLVFPCGYICGTWTFTELLYAVENCGVEILEYEECIMFYKTYPVFKNFIGVFSEIKTNAKENGEKALEKFSKLVQNVGYGYTGMRRDDKTELRDIDDMEKYEDRLLYENEKLGFIEITSDVFADYIQVQVAAYVTSYARLVLLDMARRQINKGAKVYYCDTDSLVTNMELDSEFVHKSKLGFWDLEKIIDSGIFLQPKVYYTEGEKDSIKFKGVSRDTARGFNKDFYMSIYEKLANKESGTVTVEENKQMLRSVKYTQKKGISMNTIEIRDKKLNLSAPQKRMIDYRNNTSKAYYFHSVEEFESFKFTIDMSKFYNEKGYLFGGKT